MTAIPVDFRLNVVVVTRDEVVDLGPVAVRPSLRGAKRYRHGDLWSIGRPDPDT